MTIFYPAVLRRAVALIVAIFLIATTLLVFGSPAHAAMVPAVPLATAGNYSVLGATTVTNTGPSILNNSLGLWPGTATPGFPPGIIVPPATSEVTTAVALQAQSDLTAAYINAAGRPLDATIPGDLAGQNLQGGVYAAFAKGPLTLTGNVILDGANDPNTVFIFQTNSSLITSPGSTVSLINGAQECNVFWQVTSSATLDTGSTFVGNILALTSVWVNTNVTVHGRALARNGEVTLDDDVFASPTCNLTTASTGGGNTTTPTATDSGTSSGSSGTLDVPEVPGVTGPPKTGSAPVQGNDSPLISLLILTLIIGIATSQYWVRRYASSQ